MHVDEDFLDDVARVHGAASAAGQSSAGPAIEPGKVAGAEQLDGVLVAVTRPQQELERRLVVGHAPGRVEDGLPLHRLRRGDGRGQACTRRVCLSYAARFSLLWLLGVAWHRLPTLGERVVCGSITG